MGFLLGGGSSGCELGVVLEGAFGCCLLDTRPDLSGKPVEDQMLPPMSGNAEREEALQQRRC